MSNLHGRFTINVTGEGKFTPQIENDLEALEQQLRDVCEQWHKSHPRLFTEVEVS